MKSKNTEIESYVLELENLQFKDLNEVREFLEEIKNDSLTISQYILKKIPLEDMNKLEKDIIAVDGSSFQEEFESLAISIGLAYIFSNQNIKPKYLPKIKFNPPYYATLINSIIMKTLEFQVVSDLFDEYSSLKPNLIFLDGALSFPDEALNQAIDNVPKVKEAFENYIEVGNKLFKLLKDRKIPIVAIVKQSQSNKYMLSLAKLLKEGSNFIENFNILNNNNDEFINAVKKWSENNKFCNFSEKSLMKQIFLNNQYNRTIFVPISHKYCLKAEIPIKLLKNNQLIGCYYNIINENIFFLEMPRWQLDIAEEIFSIISTFSKYSTIPGYPMPLIVAHKKVEFNRKKALSIFNLLKYITRKKIGESNFRIFFKKKFHP